MEYWKISQVVMIIMRKNIELITSHEWQIQYFSSDTITTSDIFQHFWTAMHDSYSLILNMIQQFEKITLTISFWVYDWKKILTLTPSGKTQYFFFNHTLKTKNDHKISKIMLYLRILFKVHEWLIAKLVWILANRNAQIWEISFYEINLEIILPQKCDIIIPLKTKE